jgi:hypothetical protein
VGQNRPTVVPRWGVNHDFCGFRVEPGKCLKPLWDMGFDVVGKHGFEPWTLSL